MKKPPSTSSANLPKIDEQQAIERVMRLMAVRGKSCEEGTVARLITDELLHAGIPASAIQVDQVNKKSPAGGEGAHDMVWTAGTGLAHDMCGSRRIIRRGFISGGAKDGTISSVEKGRGEGWYSQAPEGREVGEVPADR